MQYAKTCNLKYVREFNEEINLNYKNILNEIIKYIESGNYGYSTNKIDISQKEAFETQHGWKSIWIKLFDTYFIKNDKLDTLCNIVKKYEKYIPLFKISIFYPKMKEGIIDSEKIEAVELPTHSGISMAVYRYHFGILIPEGDTGMIINDKSFKWKNDEGVIFDDTLPHSSWNRTNKIRIILFGDFIRNLDNKKLITERKKMFDEVKKTKHINSIIEKLI
jgi:aspartyl/asparaginyl beta-hydroxylase (cupin superfamily)